MSDIVERLKPYAGRRRANFVGMVPETIIGEALDEIERLRVALSAERARTLAAASPFQTEEAKER